MILCVLCAYVFNFVLALTFKKPFFRTVPYDYTIYGFKDGAFFIDCYYQEADEADENEDNDEDNDEDDNGHSAYIDAVKTYRENPKMKGEMSKRYD